MKTQELVAAVRGLYGGFDPADLVAALEDGAINSEEYSALAGVMRKANYEKMAVARKESARRAKAAEKLIQQAKRLEAKKAAYRLQFQKSASRLEALKQEVAPGMVLMGSTWVPLPSAK